MENINWLQYFTLQGDHFNGGGGGGGRTIKSSTILKEATIFEWETFSTCLQDLKYVSKF